MHHSLKNVLFVTDMDGTLLTRDKRITQENLMTIDRFRRQGGNFSVASGRSIPSFRHYAELLQLNRPAILYNGVAIYDYSAEQLLWHTSLDSRAYRYMQLVHDACPHIAIEILTEKTIYVLHHNQYSKQHLETENLNFTEVSWNQLDTLPGDWFKVLYALSSKRMGELADFLKDKESDGVYYVRSDKHYYEMLPEGSSKGNALMHLAELLGVPKERTVGIGDYYNDLELIRQAGTGIAVSNAPEEIRQEADLVVADHEANAVAEALEWTMKVFG